MSPSISTDGMLKETEAPTVAVASEVQGSERSGADKDTLNVLTSLFKTREHEVVDIRHEEEGDASGVHIHILKSMESPTVEAETASEMEEISMMLFPFHLYCRAS